MSDCMKGDFAIYQFSLNHYLPDVPIKEMESFLLERLRVPDNEALVRDKNRTEKKNTLRVRQDKIALK
jgi:hypothetical protein